jgi:2,4-dienoyl-CoA reductase-like NADH-dependent reductase (Old Yellow Enzyme family)
MNRYVNLLTPLEVGNVLLKNRLTASPATPHFIQGTEPYPTEKWITMLANRARSGAAAVCVNHLEQATVQMSMDVDNHGDHFSNMDWQQTSMHNYLCQMIDAIRYYGAVTMYHLNENMLRTKDMLPPGPGPGKGPSKGEQPSEPAPPPTPNFDDPKVIQSTIDDALKTAVFFKTLGFQMLSSRIPQSSKMHTKFCLEFADALKQTLGQGYPIEFYTMGTESGISVAHNLELARMLEGKIDIFTVRYGILDWQHPTGFTSTREAPSPCLELASILTQDTHLRGAKLKIGISSGIHEPDFAEHIIASEKADMIVMGRTWISEPEYVQKLNEDRGEDVVPCVRCNKCHFPNTSERFRNPWS